MAMGGVFLYLVGPIALPRAANYFLPPADAAIAKEFYMTNLGIVITSLVGGGGLGAITGSLIAKAGKVIAQLSPGIKTEATPSGEGLGVAAVEVSANAEASELLDMEPGYEEELASEPDAVPPAPTPKPKPARHASVKPSKTVLVPVGRR